MAVVLGAMCILVGVARLGFVTDLLSKPIRYGYMNGIALTVLIGQMPKLFGFSIKADGPLRSIGEIGAAIFAGKTNWAACAIGIATLATILALKNHKRIPGILAVIGATVAVWLFDLGARTGLSVLGTLPRGLPAFAIPWITQADIVPVLLGGCAVAVVSFADTSVLSRAYAARLGEKVNSNQEMIGLGAANLAAGLFQGFPISSSASRTPVAEAAGRPNAIDRRGRRRGGGAADPGGPEPAPRSSQCSIGRSCHRVCPGPVRNRRSRPHLPHPALGILALHPLLRRRRGFWRHPGDRIGDCDRRHEFCGMAGVPLRRACKEPALRHSRRAAPFRRTRCSR